MVEHRYSGRVRADMVQVDHVSDHSSLLLDQHVPERRQYHEFWAQAGVTAILRHLLMDRCKYNPSQHR